MIHTSKKCMLSAMQPSNQLTLGNYLGALLEWNELQTQYECLFFIVDLHAITVRQDPKALRDKIYAALAAYIAVGIDPKKAILFVQSHVPEHSQLAWILNCFSTMGELNRMTQFKDKSTKQGKNPSVGLFTYPALMAADILLYQTHLVPVGEDQKQHLEFTRDLAIRFNALYKKDLFTLPEVYHPKVGARIMSLQNPLEKMSKSDPNPYSSIFLTDSDDLILKKFKKAVTDSGTEICYDSSKPGIKNLIHIYSALSRKPIAALMTEFSEKSYGTFKTLVAEKTMEHLAPIRQKIKELLEEKQELDSLLKKGAGLAQEKAQKTLQAVSDCIGLTRRH